MGGAALQLPIFGFCWVIVNELLMVFGAVMTRYSPLVRSFGHTLKMLLVMVGVNYLTNVFGHYEYFYEINSWQNLFLTGCCVFIVVYYHGGEKKEDWGDGGKISLGGDKKRAPEKRVDNKVIHKEESRFRDLRSISSHVIGAFRAFFRILFYSFGLFVQLLGAWFISLKSLGLEHRSDEFGLIPVFVFGFFSLVFGVWRVGGGKVESG